MTIFQTKNGAKTGFVPGVGAIVDGKIEGPDNLENPNLAKVEEKEQLPVVPVAPSASVAPTTSPNSIPSIQTQTTNKETN